MKSTELRIGNYFNQFGNVHQVSWETFKQLEVSQEQLWCKPILLTEDWLIKFGATTIETPHVNQYRIEDRLFVIREGKIVDYDSSVILEFVHRFQNFMFELTNKELTITQ